MAEYSGSIELISGITQKNLGTFPLVDASAVQVDSDGKTLDEKLTEVEQAITDSTVDVDATLSAEGAAADAAATGKALNEKANSSDIPSTLPNPKALSFTGAATGSYDGSAAVTINIPEEVEIEVDATLTQEGIPADAAAVGAALDKKANSEDVNSALDEKANTSDIPTALKNPNALTFTGAVTASYDGSAAVTVDIPKTEIDDTLTIEGAAADAAATGAALDELKAAIEAAGTTNVEDVIAVAKLARGVDRDGYAAVMQQWFAAKNADGMDAASLTALCDEWYDLTRLGWNGYTTFYQPDVSAVSAGTRGGDSASLSCTPSTDTTANVDDFAGLPLFACTDCNWVIDADTLEPQITAIDGISSDFVRDDPEVYVGVLQQSGYHYQSETDTDYTHGYTDTYTAAYADIEPLPEAVRVDGTVRPWVLHGKYMSKTTNSKMSNCSGVIPTAFVSHNTVHTLSAANGSQYSGGTTADDAFLKLMVYIKYASLTLDGILQGCCNCNYQYYAAAAETGVKRVLLTASQAANLEVGMSVLVGNYTSSTDRGNAGMYSITGNGGALITAIETVTVDDAEYSAVYIDAEDTFDTAANGATTEGTTCISSWHWATGSCDSVLGNDGSPTSCTSGKYPAKLQGIEYMPGGYEVYADVILSLYQSDDSYYYQPYIVRQSANQATSITANYIATGLEIIQPDTAAWGYIKKLAYANGVFFPAEVGGSSSTYARDAFYQSAATTSTREWLAFGSLRSGVAGGGLSCLHGYDALSGAAWYYLARLSPTGNRGEWAA